MYRSRGNVYYITETIEAYCLDIPIDNNTSTDERCEQIIWIPYSIQAGPEIEIALDDDLCQDLDGGSAPVLCPIRFLSSGIRHQPRYLCEPPVKAGNVKKELLS